MRDIKKEKKLAIKCSISALIFSILWLLVGTIFSHPETITSPWQCLTYALSWDMWLILFVLVVAFITHKKTLSTNLDTIDGKDAPELKIQNHFLQNTFTQVSLAIPIHIAIAFYLPLAFIAIIPNAIALIIFGALAYYIGYTLRPILRIFGFTCMLLANAILCFLVLYCSFF